MNATKTEIYAQKYAQELEVVVERAIRVLDEGNVLRGKDYFYVAAVVRKMMGIDTDRHLAPALKFDRHVYYKTSDGRILDNDMKSKTQSARIISQEQFDNICTLRAERVKREVGELLSTNRLDLTYAVAKVGEIFAALGANPDPVLVEGGEGSDSHCGWRQAHYMLPGGRTLRIGNGPDEGWMTADLLEATELRGGQVEALKVNKPKPVVPASKKPAAKK